LRITRILKCLGEFDYEEYQIQWLEAFIHEVFITKDLSLLETSLLNYWIGTVKNDAHRTKLEDKASMYLFNRAKN